MAAARLRLSGRSALDPDVQRHRAGGHVVNVDVAEAWLAAAVIHQGEHLVSFDADFKRLLSRAQFTRLKL